MRTTVDIPDPVYRQLKVKAANEGRSVKELILRSVEHELGTTVKKRKHRVVVPIIKSKQPGKLELDNAKIFELIPFP